MRRRGRSRGRRGRCARRGLSSPSEREEMEGLEREKDRGGEREREEEAEEELRGEEESTKLRTTVGQEHKAACKKCASEGITVQEKK